MLSPSGSQGSAKPDQHTTPIDLIIPPQETITVVDPRHPLFGRTLPCVGIANSCHRGRCCIVWIRPTVERHVPVTATNLAYDPTTLYPLPISVESLQQFLQEFTLAVGGRKGVPTNDDSTPPSPAGRNGARSSPADPAQPGLDHPHRGTTGNRPPEARHHVSGMSLVRKGGRR